MRGSATAAVRGTGEDTVTAKEEDWLPPGVVGDRMTLALHESTVDAQVSVQHQVCEDPNSPRHCYSHHDGLMMICVCMPVRCEHHILTCQQ